MARVYFTTTAALTACIIAMQCTNTVFASDGERAAAATNSHLTYNGKPLTAFGPRDDEHADGLRGSVSLSPIESSALRQWGGFRRGRSRNNGPATAIFLGAVGTIAGAAVLVYANRPECNANPTVGGCGYGTKVIGGAVLSAGLGRLPGGARTWG